MKRTIILYHANCPDGFSGAWAAWKKFRNRARYLPLQHQTPLPKGLAGNNLYFIDIACPLAELARLKKTDATVTVIDHHVSARTAAASADAQVFDIRHAGGVLAWRYFHPKRPVPLLLQYIEDMDLWRFRLPRAKELTAALELYDLTFSAWNKLAAAFETKRGQDRHAATGAVILRYQAQLIRRIASGASRGTIAGTQTHIVNSPVFESELGNTLSTRRTPAAIVWSEERDMIRVSLRSNQLIDVAKIAKRYGGGGHRYAAGFKFPRGRPFPWKYR